MEIPLWVSSFSQNNHDNLVVWMQSWESALNLSNAGDKPALVPVLIYDRETGSKNWQEEYVNQGRMAGGFPINDSTGSSQCEAGITTKNHNLVVRCRQK
jgi:hypothetical protein